MPLRRIGGLGQSEQQQAAVASRRRPPSTWRSVQRSSVHCDASFGTGPADATPDQRRTFEQACAAALRRRFEHDGGTLFNGRRVTAVALRGDYPDTELMVTFVEPTGDTDTEAFDIWRADPPGDVAGM
jgi:hypothetical protein